MKQILKFVCLILLAFFCSILIYYKVDKAKEVKKITDILVVQNNIEKNFESYSGYTFDNPKVILNPYGNSPLTALIIFETKDLSTPIITIKGKDENSTITNTFTPDNKHILPVYGLYPNKENEVILEVNGTEKIVKIKTDKLPKDFVLPTNVKSLKSELNNDLYFFTPSSNGYTCAYDVNGDVRWYLLDNMIWDIKRLKNGHLLLSSNRLINPPYYLTGLAEIDLIGKIYYEYSLPGGYHHDVYEMENGNFLVASNNFKNGTVEDFIIEVDRKTGEIIRDFDLSTILPKTDGKSENWTEHDWFHNNSVWYDSKTNSITLSGRHQDIVVNIDYSKKSINWILGDSTNWNNDYKKYFLKPIGKVEWQYSQHAASILPNGNIFLFDNGNNRSKDKNKYISADDNYSRGVIYKIDRINKTVEQVWQYGKELGNSFYSPYISDVDYLNNNHYLIHSGGIASYNGKSLNTPPGLSKYDKLSSITKEIKNNKIVFEINLPTNNYRSEKLSLYSNSRFTTSAGIRLGNMGITEPKKKNTLVFWNKNIDDIYKSKKISITKEIDRLVVTGTFKKNDKVEIILDNVFDKKTYDVRVSKTPYTAMCIDIFNEKNKDNEITVTKYINDLGINGKYYIYIKINKKVYDTDLYIEY